MSFNTQTAINNLIQRLATTFTTNYVQATGGDFDTLFVDQLTVNDGNFDTINANTLNVDTQVVIGQALSRLECYQGCTIQRNLYTNNFFPIGDLLVQEDGIVQSVYYTQLPSNDYVIICLVWDNIATKTQVAGRVYSETGTVLSTGTFYTPVASAFTSSYGNVITGTLSFLLDYNAGLNQYRSLRFDPTTSTWILDTIAGNPSLAGYEEVVYINELFLPNRILSNPTLSSLVWYSKDSNIVTDTLNVDGPIEGDSLNILGNATFNQNITSSGLSVSNNLSSSNLNVTNNATFNQNITTSGLQVVNNLSSSNLSVTNNATFGNNVLISGNLSVSGLFATSVSGPFISQDYTATGTNTVPSSFALATFSNAVNVQIEQQLQPLVKATQIQVPTTSDFTIGSGGSFATLQDALASPLVKNGTVLRILENTTLDISTTLTITKQVVIWGENRDTCIIRNAVASPSLTFLLSIQADYVMFNNLTINFTSTISDNFALTFTNSSGGNVVNPIVANCRIVYNKFGIVMRGLNWVVANCLFETQGTATTRRGISIYRSAGNSFVYKNTFNQTIDTSNRLIHVLETSAADTKLGTINIIGNTSTGVAIQFVNVESFRGNTNGLTYIIKDNIMNESNAFVVLFGGSLVNAYNTIKDVFVLNNRFTNRHTTSPFGGKGCLSLDTSVVGRSSSLPVYSFNNVATTDQFYRAGWQLAQNATGVQVGITTAGAAAYLAVGYNPVAFVDANISASLLPSVPTNFNPDENEFTIIRQNYVDLTTLNTTLGNYALNVTLSNYVTSNALSTTLGNYALNATLGNYVTSNALSTTLGNYALTATLSNYALNATLGNYVTGDTLSTTLGNYTTNSALSTTLGNYVTSNALSTTLGNYALNATLGNYVTSNALSTTLGNYTTNSALSTTLGNYVTGDTLSTTLGNYALNATLGNYVTSDTLSTTLGNYALTATLSNYALNATLGNYVTSNALSTTLGNYVTSSALSTTLGNYGTLAFISATLANYSQGAGGSTFETFMESQVGSNLMNDTYIKDIKPTGVQTNSYSGVVNTVYPLQEFDINGDPTGIYRYVCLEYTDLVNKNSVRGAIYDSNGNFLSATSPFVITNGTAYDYLYGQIIPNGGVNPYFLLDYNPALNNSRFLFFTNEFGTFAWDTIPYVVNYAPNIEPWQSFTYWNEAYLTKRALANLETNDLQFYTKASSILVDQITAVTYNNLPAPVIPALPYLALTGGTLTGPLFGTDASFDNVSAEDFKLTDVAGTIINAGMVRDALDANSMLLYSNQSVNSKIKHIINSAEVAQINSGGLVVYSAGNGEIRMESGTTQESRLSFGDATTNKKGRIHYNNQTNNFNFHVNNNNTPAMTISANGNVGIGTTSPPYLLSLGNSSGTIGQIGLLPGNNSSFWLLRNNGGNFNVFQPGANLDRLTVDGNGNIGIGTTTPNTKFEINAALTPLGAMIMNKPTSIATDGQRFLGFYTKNFSKWNIGINEDETGVGNGGNDLHYYSYNNSGSFITSVLILQRDGNVGIGTTNPQRKLHVEGSNMRLSNAGSATIEVFDTSSGNISPFRIAQNKSLETFGLACPSATMSCVFNTANVERMRIQPGGNVGIGLTNPSTALNVKGRFRIDALSAGDSASVIEMANLAGQINYFFNDAVGNYIMDPVGGVGIDITPTEKLHVNGNILATGTITPSDERIKENITDANTGDNLDHILALQVKHYDYTSNYVEYCNKEDITNYGFIAQQVEQVIPNAVKTGNFYIQKSLGNGSFETIQHWDDFKTINKDLIFTEAVGAIQELHKIIQAQKAQIEALELTNLAQEETISNILERLEALENN
jgi:hypothetical protein